MDPKRFSYNQRQSIINLSDSVVIEKVSMSIRQRIDSVDVTKENLQRLTKGFTIERKKWKIFFHRRS